MIGQQRPHSRRTLVRVLLVIVAIALIALVIWGFIAGRKEAATEGQRESPVEAPLRVSTQNGASVVTLDAKTEQSNAIATAALARAPYQAQLHAYASVLDLTRLTDLSNSYLGAKSQRDTAQAKLAASKMAYARAQGLYNDEQNVSLAQLQLAEAAFRTDQAALAAAQSQLRTLSDTAQQEWGSVLAQSIVDGSPLIRHLIERQQVLVQVTLPPGKTLPTPPTTASLQLDGNARTTITFVSIATRTDPRIQGVSFFYVAPASSALLTGMNVQALLPSGPTAEGVAVPGSAVVWWQDRAWVYLNAAPHAFVRTEIPTDQLAPGGGFIVKNLPRQSRIVVRGAQLLLSEEFRAQIQVDD
ncbi:MULTISPECIES: hypothetical protein [Rhodanobacter]|nr:MULTISPECIES: hypothetical protein [Rhodanobacter]KZC20239.1 hypothetical protein RHOFW104R3_26775 [Rhodanobacter denitrificans]UJM95535.1 multidrug transporter [Rhodanobacter denitrificans]UJM99066.1 multidrug transporter [Rhodanobacter denitrificans]UJN21519.1 multidrug transporter [Rhodanobacter denitrificans]